MFKNFYKRSAAHFKDRALSSKNVLEKQALKEFWKSLSESSVQDRRNIFGPVLSSDGQSIYNDHVHLLELKLHKLPRETKMLKALMFNPHIDVRYAMVRDVPAFFESFKARDKSGKSLARFINIIRVPNQGWEHDKNFTNIVDNYLVRILPDLVNTLSKKKYEAFYKHLDQELVSKIEARTGKRIEQPGPHQ